MHAGALALLVGLAAAAAPAPTPKEHAAPPLRFLYPAGYEGLVENLAARGPAELRRIAAALGVAAPQHLDVYVVPRASGIDPRHWGVPAGPDWAAGLSLEGRPVVVLLTSEQFGPYGNEAATVLTHELVHATAAHALGPRHQRLPAWMREGVAAHLAFEWRLAEEARVVRFALGRRYIPLRDITDEFPADAERAGQAYLEAFAYVNWLVDRAGPGSLRAFFDGVERGDPWPIAFADAFGDSPWRLEAEFRRGFLRRYRWIPLLTSSATAWLLISALVVVGGLRKRRRAAKLLATWEDEERRMDGPGLRLVEPHEGLEEEDDDLGPDDGGDTRP